MGVVRTNCMDNLDRTNVVQSVLARWSLNKQLRALGILADGENAEQHQEFMRIFRESRSFAQMDDGMSCSR
jgi:phosphatidylinositol 4-phosphatase